MHTPEFGKIHDPKESGTMKTIRKRLLAACSAAAVALTMCGGIPIGSLSALRPITASAAVKTQCETYTGGNVADNDYLYMASPIDSYLTALDGGFMRFQNGAVEGKYLIEYYDKDYNIQDTLLLLLHDSR
jgi:hypothetical protein